MAIDSSPGRSDGPVVSKHEKAFFAAQRRAADAAEVAEKKASVKDVMDEQGRLLDRADKIANRIYRAQVESIADVITKLHVLITRKKTFTRRFARAYETCVSCRPSDGPKMPNLDTQNRSCFQVASKSLRRAARKQPPGESPAANILICLVENGAGEGIRTLDPNLGKVVLYP
jgi:hypothetical protein